MPSKTMLLMLPLTACLHQPTPTTQPAAPPPDPRGHCTAGELVLFSCTLESKDTASLCASADLGTAPGAGTVQFRMGPLGAAEEVYPQQPKSPEFFRYEHETYARSYGDTVSFRLERFDYTLRDMIGSSHPGEAESNNFQGLWVSGPDTPQREISCAQAPTANMARLADFKPRPKPDALGLTGIELGEKIPPAVVYDGPGGKKLGVLEADVGGNPYAIVRPLRIRQDDGGILAVESMWGTRETSYEVHSLEFFAQESGFSQVLPHAGKNGLWIRDADPGGYGAIPWAEYLASLGDGVLWREELAGLKIHRSADIDSRSKTLADGIYEFSATGRHKGNWLEVKVAGYTDDFTCGGKGKPTGRRWKGWIRGSKGGGEPTVWYYTRGC